MYICEKCGKKYRYNSKKNKLFPIMDFFMFEANSSTECRCGGRLLELTKCEKCGKESTSEYALCDECMEEYKTFDIAFDIGEKCAEPIEVNGFLLSMFTTAEIELILLDFARRMGEETLDEAVKDYCNDDEEYFKEYVEEQKWRRRK